MRRWIAWCVLVLLVVIPAHAQTEPETADDCINPLRIVTWNIENLSVSRANDPDMQDMIVAAWLALDADVVAVQEISTPASLEIILEAVEAASGRHYDFALMERGIQLVGFAWDVDRITPLSDPIELEDVALSNGRPAFVMDFAFGDYDFTAVTLHFKATQSNASRQIRRFQSIILMDWYNARPDDADEDVIFLGDWNDYYDSEWLESATSTLFFTTTTLPEGSHSFLGDEFESLIDHIAVSRGTGAEDEFCSVSLFDFDDIGTDEDTFERLASDHRPVIATFRTGDEGE